MKDLIEITGTALHQTRDAVMFDFGHTTNIWLPKSVMEDWPDIGDTGEVLMPEWLALDKGLI